MMSVGVNRAALTEKSAARLTPTLIREGGAISSAGQCRIMLAKNFLHGVSGELRITCALPILGGHRVALGCSGLHANGCFNVCRNCPAPKNLCRNSPALP